MIIYLSYFHSPVQGLYSSSELSLSYDHSLSQGLYFKEESLGALSHWPVHGLYLISAKQKSQKVSKDLVLKISYPIQIKNLEIMYSLNTIGMITALMSVRFTVGTFVTFVIGCPALPVRLLRTPWIVRLTRWCWKCMQPAPWRLRSRDVLRHHGQRSFCSMWQKTRTA